MRKLIASFLLVTAIVAASCSKRIFEAREAGKFHDTYFILRKNGYYSIKSIVMDIIRMPDNEHGRYIQSSDTIYLVRKKGKKIYETYSYGVIDSAKRTFTYHSADTVDTRVFHFSKMPVGKSRY